MGEIDTTNSKPKDKRKSVKRKLAAAESSKLSREKDSAAKSKPRKVLSIYHEYIQLSLGSDETKEQTNSNKVESGTATFSQLKLLDGVINSEVEHNS